MYDKSITTLAFYLTTVGHLCCIMFYINIAYVPHVLLLNGVLNIQTHAFFKEDSKWAYVCAGDR